MCYCKTSGSALEKSIADAGIKVPDLQSDIEDICEDICEPASSPCLRIAVQRAVRAGVAGLKHGLEPAAFITLIEMGAGLLVHHDVSKGIRQWRASLVHEGGRIPSGHP